MNPVRPVRVPSDLLSVRSTVLEEYVKSRLLQFITGVSQRLFQLAPTLGADVVERAITETLQTLPPPEYGQVPVEALELQLVFRHDCLALGCLEPQCELCKHNTARRCSVNFDRKYLVNDKMTARCGSIIRIELVDRATGAVFEGELPDVHLEMLVLDGNLYDQKFLGEAARGMNLRASNADLNACSLLLNNKGQPLLISNGGGFNDEEGRVVLQPSSGKVFLPDIHITDSSEALLSGRKPPFRLCVRAMHKDGRALNIRHAVSEGFVVATRRTRTANKVDIPSIEDAVSKLDHMGRETVKKLQDLRAAAAQVGMDIDVPENTVCKVGEFKQLALRAEQDGHLRQKLQHVLKLSKEKWDEARDHAMRAVVPDNRMRAWYADRSNMDIGMLFTCRLGSVDLERPVALLQRRLENGEVKIEATLMAQQTPAQRDMMRHLQPQAIAAWWDSGHVGWTIFPMDSEQFLETGTLAPVSPLDALMPTASPTMSNTTGNTAPWPEVKQDPTASAMQQGGAGVMGGASTPTSYPSPTGPSFAAPMAQQQQPGPMSPMQHMSPVMPQPPQQQALLPFPELLAALEASGVSPVMLQNLAAAHQAGTLPPELLSQLQEMVAVARQQQPPQQYQQPMRQQQQQQQQQQRSQHGAALPQLHQQQQQQPQPQQQLQQQDMAPAAMQGGAEEEPHPFLRIQQSSMEEDEAALPESGSMSNLLSELRKDSLDMGSIPSAALPSVLLHQLAHSKSAQLRQQQAPGAGVHGGAQRAGNSGAGGSSQPGAAGTGVNGGGGPVMVGGSTAGVSAAARPPIGANGVAPLPSMGELPMLSSDLEKYLIGDHMETSLQGAFPSSIFSAAAGMGGGRGADGKGPLQSLELPTSITMALQGYLGGSAMPSDGHGSAGSGFGSGGGSGGGGGGGAFGGGAKFVGSSFQQGGGQQLHSRNSGLDCMQSIEVALPTITSGDAASLMLHHMQQELPEMQTQQ